VVGGRKKENAEGKRKKNGAFSPTISITASIKKKGGKLLKKGGGPVSGRLGGCDRPRKMKEREKKSGRKERDVLLSLQSNDKRESCKKEEAETRIPGVSSLIPIARAVMMKEKKAS